MDSCVLPYWHRFLHWVSAYSTYTAVMGLGSSTGDFLPCSAAYKGLTLPAKQQQNHRYISSNCSSNYKSHSTSFSWIWFVRLHKSILQLKIIACKITLYPQWVNKVLFSTVSQNTLQWCQYLFWMKPTDPRFLALYKILHKYSCRMPFIRKHMWKFPVPKASNSTSNFILF